MPIYEPGLEEMVERNAKAGRLTFTTSYDEALEDAEFVFIAVGTPSRHGSGHVELEYVYQAVRDIAPHISSYTVTVIDFFFSNFQCM